MLFEFDVRRCTRRCFASDRELKPGEVVVSALVRRDDHLERIDFSHQAWRDSPADCIGWWRFRLPEPESTRVHWAPPQVMIQYLRHLIQQPGQEEAAYVLAWLLVRRKICRLENIDSLADGSRVLVLSVTQTNEKLTVPEAPPGPERIAAIQQLLVEHLFTDEPPEESGAADEVEG